MTSGSPGRVIILNGAGSAGKTSIARALQAITSAPFLHVQMDTFLDMLPAAYMYRPDGLQFIPRGNAGTDVVCGPVAERLLDGMRHAVATMARIPNNIIVDDVLLDDAAERYRLALKGLAVNWVAVRASLATLEAREVARGDRLAGLSRWQFTRVHVGIDYDCEVDTDAMAPADAARAIALALSL